ncbi:unnamed protein product [Lupinus luteus]|uniref:Uncharacterized protein n=1 Tax=Lupinus luteus TaxID=3873 RepID=A0AAV1WXQ8_LUPLU
MANKVPARAVHAMAALLRENEDEGVSDGGGCSGPGEAAPGPDAGELEVGASDGVEAGVGDGGEVVVGAGAGASVGGGGGEVAVGAGVGAEFGGGDGGVAVGGGVAGGVVVVVGGWVGVALGPCAMLEVAKSPKIINT